MEEKLTPKGFFATIKYDLNKEELIEEIWNRMSKEEKESIKQQLEGMREDK